MNPIELISIVGMIISIIISGVAIYLSQSNRTDDKLDKELATFNERLIVMERILAVIRERSDNRIGELIEMKLKMEKLYDLLINKLFKD